MTDEERLKASIEQIYTYGGSQFPEWRVAVIKSIQKILVNLDEFYADLLPELEMEYEQRDIVHCQIRNGWFYEAVSQAEQAIEDLLYHKIREHTVQAPASGVVTPAPGNEEPFSLSALMADDPPAVVTVAQTAFLTGWANIISALR